ncbi:hypothetical protein EUTSA_v10029238mg [Eutrema salsugineum]|uniref:MADS-box domain-containing protein n=1 Tax=Eutrema salsugineum TaxID=72664 RepID=V4L4Q6_EUTSA|nr:hypothetical protein EUTSA_v10029238mg [Eutrema salsugineum]
MGCGKLMINQLAHANRRQSTFARRRSGLLKKARQLSTLCDAEVAVMSSPSLASSSSSPAPGGCARVSLSKDELSKLQDTTRIHLFGDIIYRRETVAKLQVMTDSRITTVVTQS